MTGTTIGIKNNSVTAGTNTASASVTVVGPPTVDLEFVDSSIPVGGETSISLAITNPNAATTLTGMSFTNTLPAGLTFGSSSSAGFCGGTVTVTAGSSQVTYSGLTLSSGNWCKGNKNLIKSRKNMSAKMAKRPGAA